VIHQQYCLRALLALLELVSWGPVGRRRDQLLARRVPPQLAPRLQHHRERGGTPAAVRL